MKDRKKQSEKKNTQPPLQQLQQSPAPQQQQQQDDDDDATTNSERLERLMILMKRHSEQNRIRVRRRQRGSISINNMNEVARDAARRLLIAADELLDRLIDHLEDLSAATSVCSVPPYQRQQRYQAQQLGEGGGGGSAAPAAVGITLPAHAVAWLSLQLHQQAEEQRDTAAHDYLYNNSDNNANANTKSCHPLACFTTDQCRLSLVKTLLSKIQHLRITNDSWPSSSSTAVADKKTASSRRTLSNSDNSDILSSLSLTHQIARLGGSSSGTTTITTTGALDNNNDDYNNPLLSSWLQAYDSWQCRPMIDLSIFSNLQTLWMKQVPPEWLIHNSNSRSSIINSNSLVSPSSSLLILPISIQVLRLEQCAIFHLDQLLFAPAPTTTSSTLEQLQQQEQEDPLLLVSTPPPPPSSTNRLSLSYPNLTHIKLLHCSLNSSSFVYASNNNNGNQSTMTTTTSEPRLPPLPSSSSSPPAHPLLAQCCTNLQVLCLAHNDLTDDCAELAGIQHLPFLRHLDLSFNYLTRFQNSSTKSRCRRRRDCRTGRSAPAHDDSLTITATNNDTTTRAARPPLSSLSCLEYLDLSHNQIVSCNGGFLDSTILQSSSSTLSPSLSSSLQVLKLHNNCLPDMAAIRVLPRLTQLKELTLYSNPLCTSICHVVVTNSTSTRTATATLSLSPSHRTTTNTRRRPWFPCRATTTNGESSYKTSSAQRTTATTTMTAYRVHVLELFLNYKAQTGVLSLSASCRQWQETMPRLDGKSVSLVELQALRGRTFQRHQMPQQQLPFLLDHNDTTQTHANSSNDRPAVTTKETSSYKPVVPCSSSMARCRRKRRVAQINEASYIINNNVATASATTATAIVASVSSTTSFASPPQQPLSTEPEYCRISAMPQQSRRAVGGGNKATCIPLTVQKNAPPTILMQQQAQETEEPGKGVTAAVASSTPPTTATTRKRRTQRQVNFTTLDVLKSLSTFTEPEPLPNEAGLQPAEQQDEDDATPNILAIDQEPEYMIVAPKVVVHDGGGINGNLECMEHPPNGTAANDEENASTVASAAIAIESSTSNGTMDGKTAVDVIEIANGSNAIAATNGDVRAPSPITEHQGTSSTLNSMDAAISQSRASSPGSINSTLAESPSRTSITNNIVSTPPSPMNRFKASNSIGDRSVASSMGASSLSRSFQTAMFPDHIWSDDNSSIMPDSVVSSSQQHDIKKYQLAEKNSKFVGQHMFKQLLILENLDLYFRLFVFCRVSGSSLDMSPSRALLLCSSDDDNDDNWQTVLETFPRIQLYPIDHRLREAACQAAEHARGGMTTSATELADVAQEDFRRVWREHVVACGKPALRRLTPMRATRLGFHGEVIWSSDASGGPVNHDVFIKCRETIICCSSTAFYIIADHDTLSRRSSMLTSNANSPNKGINNNKRKVFPLPIPYHACFAEAIWPHAMARHSFQTLRSITIGFGFQRLTLRFYNPNRQPSSRQDEDFVYILSTCNKLQTISLLKDIQGIAKECRSSTRLLQGGGSGGVGGGASSDQFEDDDDDIQIENDDPHVLEALGNAVAPDDTIGMVLHYQILEQTWKHGDRGSVRRVCLVTDTKIFLLDEDYHGDGGGGGRGQHIVNPSTSNDSGRRQRERGLGDTLYRLVDKACLEQISIVQAAGADPRAITLVINPLSRLQRTHNWRLLCRDRDGAERLVEDVRKAISLI